jgi:hypothetical protein
MDPQRKDQFDQNIERRIFCTHYSECLGFCAELQWRGFSCEGCRSYEPEHHGSEFWTQDAVGCYTLIRAAGLHPEFEGSRTGNQ